MDRTPTLALAALAALALAGCTKTDTAPVPEHNDVAAAMPDAGSTPGAVGPATAAPHPPPPTEQTPLTAPNTSSTAGPPSPAAGSQDHPQ